LILVHLPSSACLGAAGLLALLLATASPAAAQAVGTPQPVLVQDRAELRREFDALFQETLRDPGNVEVALRYATVATRLGDHEAAITALQRILFFNPSLDPARLELGVLYYRLGSYAAAREYLEEARAGGRLTAEQRARADEYLARVAAADTRHRFSGQVIAGIQHQTNANLGPSSPDVRVAGITAALSSQFVKKSDQDVFTTGSALYSYDLQDQDQSAIEVTGIAYASRFFRVHRLDLDYFETTVGPRTSLGQYGLEGFSVKPYAILNYVLLGEDPFYHSYGAGLDVAKALTPDLVARTIYEHRERNFEDAPDRATSRLLTGHTDGGTVELKYALASNQRLSGTLGIVHETGRIPSTSDLQYGGGATYDVAYTGPVGSPSLPWETALSVGRLWYDYEGPDPFVDPSVTRFDRRWRIALTQNVPITDRFGVYFQLQRDIVSSNLPNFAYSNVSVIIGPRFVF
jgi:tetratricopeptide (TPR) repeat protein